jgi:hypothetical protein
MLPRLCMSLWASLVLASAQTNAENNAAPTLDGDVLPLLKARCVKCHGPIKHEGRLNLSTARSLAGGGKSGPVIDRAEPLKSLFWRRIVDEEMPPDEPLSEDDRAVIGHWLEGGVAGLPDSGPNHAGSDHWAFQRLATPTVPEKGGVSLADTPVDRFLEAALGRQGLSFSCEADRHTLSRRLSFDLVGLPPTPDEIDTFVNDTRADAYERLVERLLASPHYGERWGKHWLDAAGYADSNGYFNADTDRPLAHRYRDYVVASLNRDKPFDQFIREQIAGDELMGYQPGAEIRPEQIESLVATHFLRNSQDGTGESDGNPDEVRADRYSVLEGTQQIIGSALFGLTLQCSKCHDHKFEPVTQVEYYQLQAILAGAFDPEHWVKPNERQIVTASAAEIAAWEAHERQLDERIAQLRRQLALWVRENRPRGKVLLEEHFDVATDLPLRFSSTAPGDDAAAGVPAVNVGGGPAPAAQVEDGALRIIESGAAGNRWLSTVDRFDWAPDKLGDTIQATFDLIADKVQATDPPAARIGFYIALADYNDNSGTSGGNVLIDGNPAGGAAIHVDYPGDDSRTAGTIGTSGYQPGHNYGVRITNAGDGRYLLEQLVDDLTEEKTVTLNKGDMPPGGFGFEFCCGRCFVVDNVVIEQSTSTGETAAAIAVYSEALKQRRKDLDAEIAGLNGQRSNKPGSAAVVVDLTPSPPDWFLLVRGNYSQRGVKVVPGVPDVLQEPDNRYAVVAPRGGASSGRRRALARWLTMPGSQAAALLARVTANRVWQQHFGTGICATADNLGYSGSPPTHPELLDYLAGELVRSGWSVKALHRSIVLSHAYRQSSMSRDDGLRLDPDNRLLWRYFLRRLDAESLRDATLAIAGELDTTMGGPYVPTDRNAQGEIVVNEDKPGGRRRSLYLQQRRTQVLSLLEVFDAPSIVTNCTLRSSGTTALQSLTALNSSFATARAQALADRLARATPGDVMDRAFESVWGRPPSTPERAAGERFLAAQASNYPDRPDAARQALVDFCQMLLASNAFLYVE